MDKVQKIKEWISKTQDGLMDANGNFEYTEHEGAYHILCNLDAYIDSLQEKPVSWSIDFEQELYKAFGQVKDFTLGMRIAKWFYDMGRKHDEPVCKDLEDATNNYCVNVRKGYPRVMDETDRYIYNAFTAGAKWQKEHLMANAVETTFNVSLSSGLYDKLWIKGCKDGDKLLVIKKDEL